MDIISIAQQAKPKPSGQIELRRAQFTALSRVVKIIPSSSSSLPKSSGLDSVTCLPRVVLIGPLAKHPYFGITLGPAQSGHLVGHALAAIFFKRGASIVAPT